MSSFADVISMNCFIALASGETVKLISRWSRFWRNRSFTTFSAQKQRRCCCLYIKRSFSGVRRALTLLAQALPRSFLLRPSSQAANFLTLSFKDDTGVVRTHARTHARCRRSSVVC